MGTCESCKYWTEMPTEYNRRHVRHGACAQVTLENVEAENGFAAVGTYEADAASFETGPKFGCVAHEPA